MSKRIVIGAALLLSTAAVGAAVAAGNFDLPDGRHDGSQAVVGPADPKVRPILLAEEAREHEGRDHRRHAEDSEDDDDNGGLQTLPQNGPADPNAPVPDNGLFDGKARPKVQVQ